ncbi:MAG: hypothetical protein ABR616_03460 [Dermatophilaceae bacterium]
MSYLLPEMPSGVSDAAAWQATVDEVRAFCGWHIAPEVTEIVTLDGPGAPVVVLPTLRLVDLVSITDDGSAVVDPEWSRSGMVRRYCWTHKFRGIVAEITHGYPSWPEELLGVMAEMAKSASTAGVKQVSSGSHQVTFESSMRPAQREVLGRYQLPFVA